MTRGGLHEKISRHMTPWPHCTIKIETYYRWVRTVRVINIFVHINTGRTSQGVGEVRTGQIWHQYSGVNGRYGMASIRLWWRQSRDGIGVKRILGGFLRWILLKAREPTGGVLSRKGKTSPPIWHHGYQGQAHFMGRAYDRPRRKEEVLQEDIGVRGSQ